MSHRYLASVTLLAIFIVSLTCYGQQQPAETDAQQWAFKGPIRNVKEHYQALNPDPRPAMPAGSAHTFWQLFDVNGVELERGELDEQDNPIKIEHFEIDPSRNMQVMRQEGRIVEIDLGPFGSTEIRDYRGDKLMFRTVVAYDELGRLAESKVFQVGELHLTRKHRYGNRVDEYWVWGYKGAFVQHRLSRYDEDGDLIEQTDYDAKDEPIVIFRLHKASLIYFWRNPACKCASSVRVEFPQKGTAASYLVDEQGVFKKEIEHFRIPWPGFGVDDETYDASGKLIDRVTCDYQDDSHGNWISRVTSVRDPKTGAMVPIAKEVRTLTYYETN